MHTILVYARRNPSTGLDSIYQKHVWSRLSSSEAPEGSDSDGNAQVTAKPLLCLINRRIFIQQD